MMVVAWKVVVVVVATMVEAMQSCMAVDGMRRMVFGLLWLLVVVVYTRVSLMVLVVLVVRALMMWMLGLVDYFAN